MFGNILTKQTHTCLFPVFMLSYANAPLAAAPYLFHRVLEVAERKPIILFPRMSSKREVSSSGVYFLLVVSSLSCVCVCVCVCVGSTLLSWYSESIAPFNLVNSLNSPHTTRGLDVGGERKCDLFLFSLLSLLSLPLFISSRFNDLPFSQLVSLQGLFAFYLLMRCILSFLNCSTFLPFWVLPTRRIYEHRACIGHFPCGGV